MKNLKKCGLFALSFALSLTALSTVFSNSANAASIYDTALHKTDRLLLGNSNNCTENYAPFYTSIMTNYTNGTIKESFFRAQQNNAGTVAVTQANMGYMKRIAIMWNETPNIPLNWGKDNGWQFDRVTAQWQYVLIFYEDGTTCDIDYANPQTYSWVVFPISTDNENDNSNTYWTNLFFTGNPNYPPSYDGLLVSGTPPSSSVEVKPLIEYQVNFKRLQAQYKKNIKNGSRIDWRLYTADDNWEVNLDNPLKTEMNVHVSSSTQFDYEFTDFGKYVLFANVYSLPPNLPIPDDLEVVPVAIFVSVDGQDISGVTDDASCNNGVCSTATLYEDCSTYGMTDVPALIDCHIANWKVWFMLTFKYLFIPSSGMFSEFFGNFRDLLNEKLGFVWYPMDWFIALFQKFAIASDSCIIDTSLVPGTDMNATFFGTTVNLNPCSAQTQFPQVYNVVVFLIRVVTVFGLLYALYHRWFELMEARDSRKRGQY